MVGHHLFAADADPEDARRAWQTWLARLFDPSVGDGAVSG